MRAIQRIATGVCLAGVVAGCGDRFPGPADPAPPPAERPDVATVLEAVPPPVDQKEAVPAEPSEPVPAPAPIKGKALLMHYMPWYKTPDVRGSWGSHWTGHQRQHDPDQTGEDGLPDIWSHYHPLIGLYDSTDRDVLECQLLQMKLAGVDGVVADWYGIAPHADYPEIHAATLALFAAAREAGMWLAVCYEDRSVKLLVDWGKLPADQAAASLADTFRWLQENWFEQPHYFRLAGRPLVLVFGPMYEPFRDPEPWRAAMAGLPVRPAFSALHNLWRQAGADGGFSWVHVDPWDGGFSDETVKVRIGEVFRYYTQNPAEAMASAYPGFNDVYADRHRELDYRGGKVMEQTLEVAMKGPWKIIQLVTWNDYGEGTMIEPTVEFGYRFLEAVQAARRTERGGDFVFDPGDLRLPVRLLALRQAGRTSPDALDRVARRLRDGDGANARRELDALEKHPGGPGI